MPGAVEYVVVVGDVDGVGAVWQAGEAIVAIGVGGGDGYDVAIGVVEHHGHALKAICFGAFQRAVGVGVLPDGARDGVWSRDGVAKVLVEVHRTRGPQVHTRLAVIATVRVDGIGESCAAVGQGGGVDYHIVGGGGIEIAEKVVAIFVGGCGWAIHAGGAGTILQFDSHALQPLAGVGSAVRRSARTVSGVEEDRIADDAFACAVVRWGIAVILVQIVCCAIDRGRALAVQPAIRVARLRQFAQHVLGVIDPHGVGAGWQSGEAVLSILVGDVGGDDVAVVVQQGHRHAGDARFAGILCAVAVGIHIDRVADGAAAAARLVAKVGVQVDVARGQRDRGGGLVVQGGVGVAGLRVSARRGHLHHVAARAQAVKDIVAGRVSRRRARQVVIDTVAVGIGVEFDGDAR